MGVVLVGVDVDGEGGREQQEGGVKGGGGVLFVVFLAGMNSSSHPFPPRVVSVSHMPGRWRSDPSRRISGRVFLLWPQL